jgi:N4-gp56 family major capsid protein
MAGSPSNFMNFTSSAGLVPTSVQEYLWRKFEGRVINDRIWDKDMQTRTVPLHNGERVKFNRMNPFAVDLTPLKQGVTPDGQSIVTSSFSATVKPYGKWLELNDEWDWNTLDSLKQETALRLGDQARDTLDAIACNAMKAGLNVQYAGGAASRSALGEEDVLTFNDVKKAVRTLKKNKAKKFADGFYHAKVGPETAFDLMADPLFVDISKYQDKSNIEAGEIGVMHGVKFFETNMPMTFATEANLYADVASVTVTGYNAATKTLTVAAASIKSGNTEEIAYFCRCMAGKLVAINDSSASTKIAAVVDHARLCGANVEVVLRWIEEDYTYGAGDAIVPVAANSTLPEVHGTIIYGQDYAGSVSLVGGKNVSIIAKGLGSSGTEDPLNQRGTLGWKIKGYTATILEDAFIVRIEHAVSA